MRDSLDRSRDIANSAIFLTCRRSRDDEICRPGLRRFAAATTIPIYFIPDDDARIVRVVGIFHGSADHERRMARRLGGEA